MNCGYRNTSELKVHKADIEDHPMRGLRIAYALCNRGATLGVRLSDKWDKVTCRVCLRLHNGK